MILSVLILIPVGLAISLPLTAWLMRLGRRAELLDSPGAAGHLKSLRHVPNIGGISIYLAVALPLLAGLIMVHVIDESTWRHLVPSLAPHLPRLRESTPTALAMLGCMTLLHLVGLLDDRRSLGPTIKLLIQLAVAALIVIPHRFDVRLLTLLDHRLPLGELPIGTPTHWSPRLRLLGAMAITQSCQPTYVMPMRPLGANWSN